MNSRRDLHIETPFLDDAAGALTCPARVGDLLARPAAGRARLRPDKLTEGAPRNVLEAPTPAADVADDRARPGRGAASVARRARDCDRARNLSLRSSRRLRELDLDLDRNIRSSRRAASGADPEEIVAEKGREEVGQAAEIELTRHEAAAA